jgi:hypothetical protein
VIGQTGLQGITGIAGVAGATGTGGGGATGVQGPTGVQGNTGLQGITGVFGTSGGTGVQGLQGVTGVQGSGSQGGGVTGVMAIWMGSASGAVTGVQGSMIMPFGYQFTNWTMTAGSTGTMVYDIWRSTIDAYPPTVVNTITGPTGVQGLNNTIITAGAPVTCSTWSGPTGVSGDALIVNVKSVTSVTNATLTLGYLRLN